MPSVSEMNSTELSAKLEDLWIIHVIHVNVAPQGNKQSTFLSELTGKRNNRYDGRTEATNTVFLALFSSLTVTQPGGSYILVII